MDREEYFEELSRLEQARRAQRLEEQQRAALVALVSAFLAGILLAGCFHT